MNGTLTNLPLFCLFIIYDCSFTWLENYDVLFYELFSFIPKLELRNLSYPESKPGLTTSIFFKFFKKLACLLIFVEILY
jgi:hypothetical protein